MKKVNVKDKIIDWILRIPMILFSIVVVFPLTWTIYTSFKTSREFYENPWALPKQLNFQNYINAFEKARMGDYFFNSVFITSVSIFFIVIISVALAYTITRFKNAYTNVLGKLFMAGLFVPTMLGIVPLFLLLMNMHLLDSYIGIIIINITYSLSFTIFVLSGFFKTFPKDYEESAFIDGCSYFKLLFKIIVPMSKPAMVTVIIFNFLGIWNEYLFAQTFLISEAKRTLTVGLVYIMEVQRYATDWGALFAGLVIVMVPTLVIYILLQNKITSGLTVGGLKG